MDLQDHIKYGENTVQEYIQDLPDLRIGMNTPDKEFRYTDYTKWRSRVVNHLKELDNNMAIKVQDLFEKFEAEFTQSAFSEVIAQLYVTLDKFNNTLKASKAVNRSKPVKSPKAEKRKKPAPSRKKITQVKKETLDNEIESKKENNKQSSQSDTSNKVMIVYNYQYHGHTIERIHSIRMFYKLQFFELSIDDTHSNGFDFDTFRDHMKSLNFAFAIIIYEATDKGCKKVLNARMSDRPSQCLMFEHGIFYELLGNDRVCALVEEGVEYPEEMSRISHIKIDNENNWIQNLIERMRYAGLDIPHLKWNSANSTGI